MHQFLLDRYVKGFNINAESILQVYNEARYGALNNLDYRKDIHTFPDKAHNGSVNALALDRLYDRYLLSGSADSSIKLWDLEQDTEENGLKIYKPNYIIPTKSKHQFGITHLKWWVDNGMWLSSSYDFSLNLFDATTMDVVHSFKLGSRVLNFDFEPNGRNFLVACCLDGGVGGLKLVDLRAQATSQNLGGGGELQGGYGYMLSCAWSPANPYLCVSGNQDGLCTGWDVRASRGSLFELNNNLTISNYKNSKSKLLFHGDRPKAHNGGVNSIIFNDVGSELITAGMDEKIKFWDLCTSNKPLNKSINSGPFVRNKNRQYVGMCSSPTKETEISFLWFPSDSGEILVYRITDGKLVARLNKNGRRLNQRTNTIIYSSNSSIRYFSGCKDGSISSWGYDRLFDSTVKNRESDEEIEFDNGVDYKDHDDSEIKVSILDQIHDEMEAKTNQQVDSEFIAQQYI